MTEQCVQRPQASANPATASRLATLVAASALALLAACSSPPPDDLNSQAALDKLYADAKADIESGSYERAIKSLERIEGRAAGTLMAQQASLDLAWAQYRSNERPAAIVTLDRFIKLNPSSPALDYAIYLKGLSNFNEDLGLFGRLARQDISERDQQASRDALLAFKQVSEQFPDSRYAEDSRIRVDYITNTLAGYEVHVARYYYTRGAYVAAANRAQQAVAEFQRAPAAEEALYLMMQSYEKLNLKPLRDDAERVLKQNFPDSTYLTGELASKPRAWWQLW
jgi:outer membrane protein assembly factor BamD